MCGLFKKADKDAKQKESRSSPALMTKDDFPDACIDVGDKFRDDRIDMLKTRIKNGDINALNELLSLAEQGNIVAQGALGDIYYHGMGLSTNYNEAAKWLAKAAEGGEPWAQYALAVSYQNGQGVPKSDTEAFKWMIKSAQDVHNPIGQYSVACSYARGTGITKSPEEAARWCRASAELGYAPAMRDLGWSYHEGLGVPKSKADAKKWLQMAVDKGDPKAKEMLDFVNTSLTKEIAKGSASVIADTVKTSIRIWKR